MKGSLVSHVAGLKKFNIFLILSVFLTYMEEQILP